MEKCPVCNRIYQDHALAFCIDDGARLIQVNASDKDTAPYRHAQPTAPSASSGGKNKWLIFGGIAAAFVILLIGAGLLIVLAVRMSANANAGANQSSGAANSSEKYKPEVLAAISRANDASELAFATYNTDQLRARFSGEALKTMNEQIELLQKNNMYRISTLESENIESLEINDAGTEAKTRLTQIRSSVFKDKQSANCVGKLVSRKISQVWNLKRTSNGWMIDSIIYDLVPNVSPLPCS